MRSVLLFLVLSVTSACCTTATTPSLPAVTNGVEEDEERLWRRSASEQEILNRSRWVYSDDELNDYLEQIAKKLQPPEIWAQIPFKVKVIKNPHLNAFAFPNGALYIHTGILARMDNEAQLAALLGHEMTHCTHRHALRTFRYVKNKTLFLTGVQGSVAESAELGNLGGVLGNLGSRISKSGYSQKLETEADLVGLRLMVNAGYDPREALKLFDHLKRELEEENLSEPFFFGSHPRLRKRIDNCVDFLKDNYVESQHGTKNTEVFLKNTHKVILQNAWLDLKAGRFRSARRGAEKYLKFKPNEARPYYLLGEIFRQRGEEDDMKRAKASYEKALTLNPSYPDIHKSIGLIYYKEGKKTLAKRSFEACLSLAPHRQDEAYILAYLRRCIE
jgi:predicted Zn-dependent protease